MADYAPPVLSGTLTKRGGKDLYGKNTWRLRHFQLHLASEKTSSLAFHHREGEQPRGGARRRGGERGEESQPDEERQIGSRILRVEPTHARQQPKGQFEVTSKSTVITLEDEKIFEEHGWGSKYLGKKLFAFYSKMDVSAKEINSGVSNAVVVCECENQQVLQSWVTALSDAIAREQAGKQRTERITRVATRAIQKSMRTGGKGKAKRKTHYKDTRQNTRKEASLKALWRELV